MQAGAVDESADWVAVSDLAQRYGCTRQNISKRVGKLREAGRLPTRGDGRSLRVHLPTYAEIVAASHDPAQDLRNRGVKREESAPAGPRRFAPSPSEYDSASAREKKAKAELAELQIAQRRGELVQVREIADASIEAGTSILQTVTSIKSKSGILYAASRGGEDALRVALVQMANDALAQIAESMSKLAANGATETD